MPACRSCSPLGLPYTTTSNYAFQYDRRAPPIPIKRSKSVSIRPKFSSRSNSVSSTSGTSTLFEASSPSASISTSSESSSNHFFFAAPPPVPEKDNHFTFPKRPNLHTRTASSPALVTNMMHSNGKSGRRGQMMSRISQSQDFNSSTSFPVEDWREELQTEEADRGPLWKISQRWRHKHGKTSTSSNNMRGMEDWDPDEDLCSKMDELITPSQAHQHQAKSAIPVLVQEQIVDRADNTVVFPSTLQSIPSSRPGTLRTQTLPAPTKPLSFLARIQSTPLTRTESAPEYFEEDSSNLEDCEEVKQVEQVKQAKVRRQRRRWSPREFDVNGEKRIHETFQWLGRQPSTTSRDLARCLADSGWTIHRSDDLY